MTVKHAQAGQTPAHLAAAEDCGLGVIRVLHEHGVDVNVALYTAVRSNRVDTTRFLLENGADVNVEDTVRRLASALRAFSSSEGGNMRTY